MTPHSHKSDRAGGVKPSLGFKVRLICLLRGVVPADKCVDAVGAYACAPAASASEPRYAEKAGGFVSVVRAALVLYVACGAYVAKVVETVILRISILVVDSVHRPRTSHVEPCQPTGTVANAVVPHDNAPIGRYRPGHSANHYFSTGFNPPCEHPRRRVVAQDFAQLIVCDATVCHSVSMT